MRGRTLTWERGLIVGLLLGAVGAASCLEDKGGNGWKGLNHELTIFAVVPDYGATTGGTEVVIIGFNFRQDGPIADVLFGDTPASAFTVHSNNRIYATTPPHPWGVVDVTVQNLDGDEATLEDGFEFVAWVRDCLTLDPQSGPDSGGTPVTIETSGFTDDFTISPPRVYFDVAEAISVTPVDAATVIAITPPDPDPLPAPALHPVDVTVESANRFEICDFPQGFVYIASPSPCMTIQPSSGPLAGGTTVTITSLDYCLWTPNTTVTFGGVPATNLVLISATVLQCETPPGAPPPGPVDVEVTGATPTDPCSCVLPDGFTYLGAPACLNLYPTSGPVTGGTQVTIETSGFTDDFMVDPPLVYFDTAQATTVTPLDSTTVLATAPPDPNPDPLGLDHPVDVTVEATASFESCVFLSGFIYVSPGSGGCLSVDPNAGPLRGGNTVTITALGTCRWDTAPAPPEVWFDGIPATDIVMLDGKTLTCTVPAGRQQGLVDVTISGWDPTGPCTCVEPDAYAYW